MPAGRRAPRRWRAAGDGSSSACLRVFEVRVGRQAVGPPATLDRRRTAVEHGVGFGAYLGTPGDEVVSEWTLHGTGLVQDSDREQVRVERFVEIVLGTGDRRRRI